MGDKSKKSSQIWFHAVRLMGGGGETNAHSAFGDQDECCIGSMTKTLKAMHDPAFECPPSLPRRQGWEV